LLHLQLVTKELDCGRGPTRTIQWYGAN
jgi:hypothetical protein